MNEREVVVVGAGAGGLATALALKDEGVPALVLERTDDVGSSWRSRYDRLRLNTVRPFSHLPGRRFSRGTPLFPTRNHLVEHLERHAAENGMDIRFGTAVDRIERDGDGWVVETSGGPVRTRQVVVATGHEHEPLVPDWPGRERFEGTLIHSSDYRRPAPFVGKRVLVVGPGCSGMEIAYDVAEGGAEKVWLAVRTPPNIVLRVGTGGIPGDVVGVALLRFPSRVGDTLSRFGRRMDIGDLSEYGLPVPEEGVMSRLRRLGVAPSIVDKEVIEAIRARRIEITRGVESLDESGVTFTDGARVEPHAVICATGYRCGLEPLVGQLGVLDERGLPRALGREPALPGLRFVGYVPRPGGLGYMAKEARQAAKAIRRELRSAAEPPHGEEPAAAAAV